MNMPLGPPAPPPPHPVDVLVLAADVEVEVEVLLLANVVEGVTGVSSGPRGCKALSNTG